jgi:hypothetical protein
MQDSKSGLLVSVWTSSTLAATLTLAGCGGGWADSASSSAAPQSWVSWDAPTTNTNRSALTNLGGYRIHDGTSSTQYNPGLLTCVVDGLSIGTTYCFAIPTVTTGGVESAVSAVVSELIS